MNKKLIQLLAVLIVLVLGIGLGTTVAYAEEVTDEEVLAVISQLEAIDSLQQMQDARYTYSVGAYKHYDINTTDEARIALHEEQRLLYETYVSKMFAARAAAQQAYDALTDDQKAQIDPTLVAKLTDKLETKLTVDTYPVTPRDDEYTFEAVKGGAGFGYEVSNHMVAGNIPQTFILVDTADGTTEWTPNGKYVYGESNYILTYCCDVMTPLAYGTDYKRVNLEDSGYYNPVAARHIRGILMNSYPFVSMDEMKANLKAGGLDEAFVDSLTRADMIAAVQMAVWAYANNDVIGSGDMGYFATIDVPHNNGNYFTAMHDYTSECWDWLPGALVRTYNEQAHYRVNNLIYYLCNLEGVAPADDEIIISDVKVTRADLLPGSDNTYNVGMYVYLNDGGSEQDDLKVVITSYHTEEDGSVTVTSQSNQVVAGREKLEMFVRAHPDDTIKVEVEGTQTVAKGVYFYEPEGGRDASQSLVGVAQGKTNVRAETSFTFTENAEEMGLRIYKTATGTGKPLSDIVFHIYSVVTGEGETLNPMPTEEEIAKYATEENKVGSVTTDVTGYASIELEEGTYLIVEEHNAEKVKAPAAPFYVAVPMIETTENEDGTSTVTVTNIVSVYPKNEPTPPEEPPIIPPPPVKVTGQFEILKYDAANKAILLEGAKFEVYRAAEEGETGTVIVECDGIQYAVVPVVIDDELLTLTTDVYGKATSPELPCGTYFLVEVDSPAGYNLLEEAVTVTVQSKEMSEITVVEIPNHRGHILPETGAEGAKWFMMIGGIVVVAAAILLVTKKRMSVYEG